MDGQEAIILSPEFNLSFKKSVIDSASFSVPVSLEYYIDLFNITKYTPEQNSIANNIEITFSLLFVILTTT